MANTGWKLRGVELFASGVFRGKPYTVADLEEIVRNGKKLGPSGMQLILPPAVLGHEENQTLLERSDLPAAGWINPDSLRVRKYFEPKSGQQEAVLVGDLIDVPDAIAERLRDKRYRRVSAEIYDDFRDDFGNTYGKAVRRLAFLGGEVPQVKRLKDLPEPTRFSERETRSRTITTAVRMLRTQSIRPSAGGITVIFSEVNMDPKQAILAAMPNINPATLDAMTPDQLADLAKNLPAPAPVGSGATNFADMDPEALKDALMGLGETEETLAGMTPEEMQELYAELTEGDKEQPTEDMGDMTREDMIAELTAQGVDPTTLGGKTDEELAAMLDEAPAPTPPVTPMSERGRRQPVKTKVQTYTERTEQLARANLRRVEALAKTTKRADAVAFCETLAKDGKIAPSQKDVFVRDLLRADDIHVKKFSEGKGRYSTQTAYERRKAELSRMPPVIKYGERIREVTGDEKKAIASAEVNKVEKFCERHSDELRKSGADPKDMVKLAKEMADKDPKFRAETLLGSGFATV